MPALDAATDSTDTGPAGVCSEPAKRDAGVGLTAGLIAWYPCESPAGASGTLLTDATRHGNDGTLVTGAGGASGYSFAPGKVGNALALSATQQGHVKLPAGLLASACEVTIAAWVFINSDQNPWMRIWDFGQDTTTYMFLTSATNYNRRPKFAITSTGRLAELGLEAPAVLPTLEWTHVALVLGPSGAVLYVNGVAVATGPSVMLRPADLGPTMNNYIGRSQYPQDPYLDGSLDELRIYNRALSPDEIREIVSSA